MTPYLLPSMRTAGLMAAVCCLIQPLSADPPPAGLEKVLADRDFKRAIAIQKQAVDAASEKDKGEALKSLAFLYLKDQDQENAFAAFLKALEKAPSCPGNGAGDPELYQKAFDLYLDPSGGTPQEKSRKLIALLSPAIGKEGGDPLLQYFVAIAYANSNRYDELFEHFYRAYAAAPDHYLAYKTKAVLQIKILERTRGEGERNKQRRVIKALLEEALKREPRDVTIYRLLISFSPADEKEEQVRRSLNKIIAGNIMVPRSDLLFYTQEAVDIGERELAARFIQRSREWYPQSRIIGEAQDYLDAHK